MLDVASEREIDAREKAIIVGNYNIKYDSRVNDCWIFFLTIIIYSCRRINKHVCT